MENNKKDRVAVRRTSKQNAGGSLDNRSKAPRQLQLRTKKVKMLSSLWTDGFHCSEWRLQRDLQSHCLH
jgi:hypothetical protein